MVNMKKKRVWHGVYGLCRVSVFCHMKNEENNMVNMKGLV